MIEFKVGILGAGHIAGVIADTLNDLEGFTPYAVASRDLDKAVAFGTEHNVKTCYGSYDELIADPEVELIYIATVNSTHAELAKKCIEAGKPSLVEKPFSYNAETTKEVLDLAKEKNVFCSEAMWLRYHPLFKLAMDVINKGGIGEVRTMTTALGYDLKKSERVLSAETAGGSLLDLGVYVLTAAFTIMGSLPISVSSTFSKLKSGVDAFETIQMNFPKGRIATVTSTMLYKADNRAVIYGTAGRIEIENINCPESVKIFNADGELAQEIKPNERYLNGYEFEFMAAREAVIVGRIETAEVTTANTVSMYNFIDTIRATWDVTFPLPGEEKIKDKITKAQKKA